MSNFEAVYKYIQKSTQPGGANIDQRENTIQDLNRFCLGNCDSLLFYLGGTKMNTSSSKRNRDNGGISNEAFVFDMVDLCWLRMTNRLPKAIIRFGTLFISPHLYLIGGKALKYLLR